MPKDKLDGVVEAVHYDQDRQVKWVRAYLRRGPTFSDHKLVDRQALIELLKSGKKIFAGQRIPLQASTFMLGEPLNVIRNNGSDIVVTGNAHVDHDWLDQVPII